VVGPAGSLSAHEVLIHHVQANRVVNLKNPPAPNRGLVVAAWTGFLKEIPGRPLPP